LIFPKKPDNGTDLFQKTGNPKNRTVFESASLHSGIASETRLDGTLNEENSGG
jgi:hypothetical protein